MFLIKSKKCHEKALFVIWSISNSLFTNLQDCKFTNFHIICVLFQSGSSHRVAIRQFVLKLVLVFFVEKLGDWKRTFLLTICNYDNQIRLKTGSTNVCMHIQRPSKAKMPKKYQEKKFVFYPRSTVYILYILGQKALSYYSLNLVHSIPSWLVWAEIKCTVFAALSK